MKKYRYFPKALQHGHPTSAVTGLVDQLANLPLCVSATTVTFDTFGGNAKIDCINCLV